MNGPMPQVDLTRLGSVPTSGGDLHAIPPVPVFDLPPSISIAPPAPTPPAQAPITPPPVAPPALPSTPPKPPRTPKAPQPPHIVGGITFKTPKGKEKEESPSLPFTPPAHASPEPLSPDTPEPPTGGSATRTRSHCPPAPPPAPPAPAPAPEPAAGPRRTTRVSNPPGEWWKVRLPTPSVASDSEEE